MTANSSSKLRIAARLDNLAAIRRFVEDAASSFGIESVIVGDVVQAVDESATNVVVHGYRDRPGEIEVEIGRAGNELVVILRDQAPPFDPTQRPSPDVTLPLDERPLGGLGVFLTRRFMDQVSHRVTAEGGNELTLVKNVDP